MRQIFTSPRLENVEAVEQLLNEAGVETRVTERRSWARATKRDFSYADRSGSQKWPAVWVVKADDYARARQLLRDQGVAVETTRPDVAGPSYLPGPGAPAPADPVQRRINRVRVALLVAALVGATIVTLKLSGVL
jgi:hypothetical protein